ncbi:hypothetical protein [Bradyrhizobium sp. RT5a]|uniref:hypothetical protein n=1 Tax=unclassified Bradyrhizobium TaxID=2631580 RepID=UPI003398F901
MLPEAVRVEKDHRREIGSRLGILVLFRVLEHLPESVTAASRESDTGARLGTERLFLDAILELLA